MGWCIIAKEPFDKGKPGKVDPNVNLFFLRRSTGVSIPSYVAAVLISLIFGYYLSDYTGLNLTGQLWESTPLAGRKLHLENLILPALTLGLRPLSMIVQLTRGSMLDALSQDYVRTARAKGLRSMVTDL